MDTDNPRQERTVFQLGVIEQEVPEEHDVYHGDGNLLNGSTRPDRRMATIRSVSFELEEEKRQDSASSSIVSETPSLNGLGDVTDSPNDQRKKATNRFGRRNLSGVLAPRLTTKDQKDFTVATPEEFVSRFVGKNAAIFCFLIFLLTNL